MVTPTAYFNTTANISVETTPTLIKPDATVIGVVVTFIVLTVVLLGILMYHYMCHNKGDYRTTGELAPGEDPNEEGNNQTAGEKKEYFI